MFKIQRFSIKDSFKLDKFFLFVSCIDIFFKIISKSHEYISNILE
jgi:hypothetical protein